ncbi:hypothetical protein M569_05222, partial [Genlisea aurea]
WIDPPMASPTPVVDRLIQALSHIRNSTTDAKLIQVWVPVDRGGGERVLTTNDQPFSLHPGCPSLAHYREISVDYHFPAEDDSEGVLGLPGRVFRSRVPEWTPDVRFFTWDEYPRIVHARKYDVRGSLVVPVLEEGSRSCLGVVEVVLTTQKIRYRPELESVCKALEAVNLRAVELSSSSNVNTSDSTYQAALPEILHVLRSACFDHSLPLAQTWVSCISQGKQGCRHSNDNVKNCVSPVESACCIFDPHIRGFHEACSEYHLLKGLGVVGRAFNTNKPCFSNDVTSCSKTEYPLSHYAKMFGLKGAVAIRLRSASTGSTDFVLEFFLPVNCEDSAEQKKLLISLSKTVQDCSQTLYVVTDEETNYTVINESKIAAAQSMANHQESSSSTFKLGSKYDYTFVFSGSTSETLATNRKKEKRRIKAEKAITLQDLRQHFAGTLKEAARNLGVCPTTLKRVCRQHGIQRWPSRTIKKVDHSLKKIQRVIESVHGASNTVNIKPFSSNFTGRASSSRGFPESNTLDDLNLSERAPAPAGLSVLPSSSCSQSSSSSGSSNRSPASDGNNLVPIAPAAEETVPKSQERNGPRVKVRSGEDSVRFRMQSNWSYSDLFHEISQRFGADDPDEFHLRYLDDESDWILLTCDADLDECIRLYRSSPKETIKL